LKEKATKKRGKLNRSIGKEIGLNFVRVSVRQAVWIAKHVSVRISVTRACVYG